MKKGIYWLPRILAILFIAFISLFALDVFSMPEWYFALFMHLIPSFIFTLLTVFAWKKERVGGLLFLMASLSMFYYFRSTVIAVPAFVIGLLFIAGSYRVKLRK